MPPFFSSLIVFHPATSFKMSVVPSNKVYLDCIPLNTIKLFTTQKESILTEADTLTTNKEAVKQLIRDQYDLRPLIPFIESDSVDMLTMYTTIDGQRINMMRILILKLSSSQYQQDGIYRVSNEKYSIQHGTENYRDVEYFQRLIFGYVSLIKGGKYLYVAPLVSMALNLLKSGFQYLVIHRALTTAPITPQRIRDVMSGTAPKYEEFPDSDDDEDDDDDQYNDTTVSEKLDNWGIRENCHTAEERLSLLKHCCSENRSIKTIYTLYDDESGKLALKWDIKDDAYQKIKECRNTLDEYIKRQTGAGFPDKTLEALSNHVKAHLRAADNKGSFYLPYEISDINNSAYVVTLDNPKKRAGTGFTQWSPWLVIDREKMLSSAVKVDADADANKGINHVLNSDKKHLLVAKSAPVVSRTRSSSSGRAKSAPVVSRTRSSSSGRVGY